MKVTSHKLDCCANDTKTLFHYHGVSTEINDQTRRLYNWIYTDQKFYADRQSSKFKWGAMAQCNAAM